ncbi:acetylxylan esterase [Naasia lichenicola]|uniref:Acetylxylan esterase n=1 Tax=Naasia lichenicola TaxID=2565933 RepID=A0A4V3WTR2_9MICO|nr:acetylxylan esterase [Naasia lichenicola]THG32907.1 acetylxylan esterase [Naasia lichenicola]
MFTDLPLDQLRAFSSRVEDPTDFDDFWAATVDEADDAWRPPTLTRVEDGTLRAIEVFDVTMSGYAGQPVRGWLRMPAGSTEPLPAVVQYVGYGGGRGRPIENLALAASGFVHLQMDTRGQGSSWSAGATPDDAPPSGPQISGVMTRGIESRESYYYRRLVTDAVMAVRSAASLDLVDASRIGVAGGSQGGALALAATALNREFVAAAAVRVPFLSDIARAITLTDSDPYHEVARYLATHRERVGSVTAVLAYFDSVNFARRAVAPARFSVALMDAITPPSTVFAAYNAYAGPKEITEWAFNGHEAGGPDDDEAEIAFLQAALHHA